MRTGEGVCVCVRVCVGVCGCVCACVRACACDYSNNLRRGDAVGQSCCYDESDCFFSWHKSRIGKEQ